MNEQDFYKLHIGQEIWLNSKKKTIKVLSHGDTIKRVVSFDDEDKGQDWQDIMADCSLYPFEVKKDCECLRFNEMTDKHYCSVSFQNISKEEQSCFNCPDYEKKKKVVRYWGERNRGCCDEKLSDL